MLTGKKKIGGGQKSLASTRSKNAFPYIVSDSAFAFSLIMVLVISLISSLPEVSRGQCPDSMTPTPGPSWIGPYSEHIQLPGTNCWVTVTFCDRNVGIPSDWETYIESITPDAGDTCQDPESLFKGTFNAFVDGGADPSDIDLDTCGQGSPTTVTAYLMQCWYVTYDDPAPGFFTFTACPNGISCTATITECIDPVTKRVVITSSSITGTYSPNCSKAVWPWPVIPPTKISACYDGGNMCGPN